MIEPPLPVHRGRSPGARWVRLAYGIHRLPSEAVASDAGWEVKATARRSALVADLWAWGAVLRDDACFTHLTSAIVRGWWLPQLPDGLPVWIAQAAGQHASRRSGVRVIRRASPTPYEDIDGLRLATAVETIAACAQDLALGPGAGDRLRAAPWRGAARGAAVRGSNASPRRAPVA